MTGFPLVFWIIAAIFAAPHIDSKTATKYAWISTVLGVIFWGIESAIP